MGDLKYEVQILEKEKMTHDVIRFRFEKPLDFYFTAGQAIELTIPGREKDLEDSPFTLTALAKDRDLEIMYKVYPSHKGTTLAMSKLEVGDYIKISPPFDTFEYKSPGVFIAGGTGVTPFIAIFRQLNEDGNLKGNKLIFANKKEKDIFLQPEFNAFLGLNYIPILSQEDHQDYFQGRVNKAFLQSQIDDFSQQFYLCGPEGFSEDIAEALKELGASEDKIMMEY